MTRRATSGGPWERVTPRVCGLVTGGALRERCIIMVDMIDLADVEGMLLAAYGAPDTRDYRDEADGGQGESLVPPYTRGSVSLSLSLSLAMKRAVRIWWRGSPPRPQPL